MSATEGYTDRYLPFLRRGLTPPRLQHSLGVMRVMRELAKVYSLDRTRAAIAGLLHDAARDLELERQMTLAEEAKIELCHPCERHPQYLHGPVGAYLVSKEFEITDQLILDAISTHTYYGHELNFDTPFAWCLRFADLLAPSRDWEGMKKLETVVHAGKMEEAALLQTAWVMELFREISIPIHPNMERVFQRLATRLNVDSTFFERW